MKIIFHPILSSSEKKTSRRSIPSIWEGKLSLRYFGPVVWEIMLPESFKAITELKRKIYTLFGKMAQRYDAQQKVTVAYKKVCSSIIRLLAYFKPEYNHPKIATRIFSLCLMHVMYVYVNIGRFLADVKVE